MTPETSLALSAVLHDLRMPLTSARLWAIVLRTATDPREIAEAIDHIVQSIDEQDRLMARLQDDCRAARGVRPRTIT